MNDLDAVNAAVLADLTEVRIILQRLRVERDALREALVRLVGCDGRDELTQMAAVLPHLPAPPEDRESSLYAVRILLATLGEPPDGTEICGAGKHFKDAGYPCPECAKS